MVNYKLAKEIGATHIHKNGDFYKFDSDKWMNYPTTFGGERWEDSYISDSNIDRLLTKIPRTRTEYEKVTESIFDLRDEFERGELYMKFSDDYEPIPNETQLSMLLDHNQCWRKVEKEIDERQEFVDKACKVADWAIPKTMGMLYDAGCRFQD